MNRGDVTFFDLETGTEVLNFQSYQPPVEEKKEIDKSFTILELSSNKMAIQNNESKRILDIKFKEESDNRGLYVGQIVDVEITQLDEKGEDE